MQGIFYWIIYPVRKQIHVPNLQQFSESSQTPGVQSDFLMKNQRAAIKKLMRWGDLEGKVSYKHH